MTEPEPDTSAEPGQPTRLAETHSACVLLVGDRVDKWKKPVDFGFLDFTRLEQREQACARELELNRRLAPDVYLDVATLVCHDVAYRAHVRTKVACLRADQGEGG